MEIINKRREKAKENLYINNYKNKKIIIERKAISIFEILTLIIASFAFAYLISSSIETVEAQQTSVCCERTKSGAFCQNSKPENCDNTYRQTPTSCDATSFCSLGCCYDSQEGICMENTPEIICSASNGTWANAPKCNIPQCNLGCCILGSQASFVTLVRCKKLASYFGVEADFRRDVTNEETCIALANAQDTGACVYESDYQKTCKFTTRGNCQGAVEGNGTLTNATKSFHKDFLCSAEELGTNCGMTKDTICVEGKEEVYFKDSCGNPANIYDSSKINDKSYWRKVVKKEDSCNAGSSNANSASCGNCNYLQGSFCQRYTKGKDKVRPTYGDNICRDLNCKGNLHGETWCEYDDKTGKGQDAVGSKHYREVCFMGEVTVEPCADYRQQVCIEDSISGFSQAGCRVNRWQDCLAQTNKKDCENTDLRDCFWKSRPKGEITITQATNALFAASPTTTANGTVQYIPASPATATYQPSTATTTSNATELNESFICVPNVPPGLKFWETGEAQGICSQASAKCEVKFKRSLMEGIFGKDYDCKENCECLKEDWAAEMNSVCISLGDCGGYINFIGKYTDDGYEWKKPSKPEEGKGDLEKKTLSQVLATKFVGKIILVLAWLMPGKLVSGQRQLEHVELYRYKNEIYAIEKGYRDVYKYDDNLKGLIVIFDVPQETIKSEGGKVLSLKPELKEVIEKFFVSTSGGNPSLPVPSRIGEIVGHLPQNIFEAYRGEIITVGNSKGTLASIGGKWGVVDKKGAFTSVNKNELESVLTEDLKKSLIKSAGKDVTWGKLSGKLVDLGGGRYGIDVNGEITNIPSNQLYLVKGAEAATQPYGVRPFWGIFGTIKNKFLGETLMGLQTAMIVAGIIQGVGRLIGLEEEKINSLTYAAASGIMAGKIAYGLGLKGGFIGATGIGIGAGLIVLFVMWKDEETVTVTFTCMPWQAPIGGQDCAKCNDKDKPCSEYRCKSLGQACGILNAGTESEMCAWLNPGDVTSPTIEPLKNALTLGHSYKDVKIRPPGLGMKIRRDGASDGCVKPFTPLTFGIKTNEPSQCKIDYNHTRKYEDMKFFMAESNLFMYEHNQTLSLPSPSSTDAQAPELKHDGRYLLYIRCMDGNGNYNEDEFAVEFCVERGPDVTPPRIESTSIVNGMPIAFNTTSVYLEVYVNEPADCKWSREDRDYDSMEYSMSCSQNIWEMNAQMLYKCTTTLTRLENRKDNVFWFRCKDQPWANESDRQVNKQGYKFVLKGTQLLNIVKVAPNGTIYGSTDIVSVNLEAETANGYNDGDATCEYKESEQGNWIKFYETGTNLHKQRLDLSSGKYTYFFRCTDLGGNQDTNKTNFIVEIDKKAPEVTRVYSEGNSIKIITNEEASCRYSLQPEQKCNFNFENGIEMKTEKLNEHTTDWRTQNIYIKCSDKYGNQPNPLDCSIIVRPYNLQ